VAHEHINARHDQRSFRNQHEMGVRAVYGAARRVGFDDEV
jgi:hypothetical protein